VTNLAAAGATITLFAQWAEGPPPGGFGKILILQGSLAGNNNSGAAGFARSAVELYNDNDFDIDLGAGDYYLHVGTGRSTEWTSIKLEGTIPAKSSFLIVSDSTGDTDNNATPAAILPTADQTATFTVPNGNYKFVVTRNRSTLSVANPFTEFGPYEESGDYIDMLGCGSNVDGEGTALSGQSRPQIPRRNSLIDTDNNSLDFTLVDYRAAGFPGTDRTVLYRLWPRNSTMGAWNPITGLPQMHPALP
jgi:hypothetical protein